MSKPRLSLWSPGEAGLYTFSRRIQVNIAVDEQIVQTSPSRVSTCCRQANLPPHLSPLRRPTPSSTSSIIPCARSVFSFFNHIQKRKLPQPQPQRHRCFHAHSRRRYPPVPIRSRNPPAPFPIENMASSPTFCSNLHHLSRPTERLTSGNRPSQIPTYLARQCTQLSSLQLFLNPFSPPRYSWACQLPHLLLSVNPSVHTDTSLLCRGGCETLLGYHPVVAQEPKTRRKTTGGMNGED